MLRAQGLLLTLICLLASSAHTEILDLGEGLAIEPEATLALTYRPIPSYDANKKMLASWSDEKLQYFISVNRLPRGWSDPEQYFNRLLRDLSAVSSDEVEILDQGNYTSANGFSGTYITYSFKPNGSEKKQQQVAHFLTNSRTSYVAIGALVNSSASTRMHDDSIAIFKTASLAQRPR
ncbi:MAG: hypothetical protein JWM78_1492 [Verrucomicrobiaceae bacterium]|nr:hypothetical protein [Verrucomicrobiaceae bacterium]